MKYLCSSCTLKINKNTKLDYNIYIVSHVVKWHSVSMFVRNIGCPNGFTCMRSPSLWNSCAVSTRPSNCDIAVMARTRPFFKLAVAEKYNSVGIVKRDQC